MNKSYFLFFFAFSLLFPAAGSAGLVAVEVIKDTKPLDAFSRDLRRIRTFPDGTKSIESNDATIVAENFVSDYFGIWNNKDVSYTHDLEWVTPSIGEFIKATLIITAWGADGLGAGDDAVYADAEFVGFLETTRIYAEGKTTTKFKSSDGALLDILLGDGLLNVEIDKNVWAGKYLGLDQLSVYGSKLKVEYLAAVPEPSALLFGLTGMVVVLALLRRRRE